MSTLLLGVTTILAAFAAYQSALWGGESSASYSQATATVTQSSSQMLLAVQTMVMDGVAWMHERAQRRLGAALGPPVRTELADHWRGKLDEDFRAALTWAEANDKTPFGGLASVTRRFPVKLALFGVSAVALGASIVRLPTLPITGM